jgi:hypothetical protein
VSLTLSVIPILGETSATDVYTCLMFFEALLPLKLTLISKKPLFVMLALGLSSVILVSVLVAVSLSKPKADIVEYARNVENPTENSRTLDPDFNLIN